MTVANFLTAHELFRLLSPEEVSRVAELSSEKQLRPGEIIYRRQTPISHFFLVLEGTVLLQLPSESGHHGFAVTRVQKGELFGLSSILGFDRFTVRAQADTSATVLAIEARPFLTLLASNPTARIEMISSVARSYYTRYLRVLKTVGSILDQLSIVD